MAIPMRRVSDILWKSGCLDFVRTDAEEAVTELERMRPEVCAMLTEEARESLCKSFRERSEILYYQALTEDVRERMNRFDLIHSMIISRESIEPARKAAEALANESGGRIGEQLRTRYPLLVEYEKRVRKNYIDSYLEFFDALCQKREEISTRLLNGKPFTRIQRLSAGGADLHRRGRSVMGVWTDAGAFYYKPHDCGLDALYHEIVTRWFTDCTVAADVVEGKGFAFVTCLRQEPVESEQELSDYFRNFGILTALFHGLGSCDMHQENVMACGVRPAAIDIETLIVPMRGGLKGISRQPQSLDMIDSALRVGILPHRMYHMPLMSPLYTASDSVVSLPEFKGRRFTVAGYENRFREGFDEGYLRLLDVRGEIKARFKARRDATVRCLLQNTSYYDQIRRILFRPEYLSDIAEREKVFHRLCVPYKQAGMEMPPALLAYERSCLLQTDIPYYCTALESRDLCGETTEQVILPGQFPESALQTVTQRLAQLSKAELSYEDGVILDAFAQAPLDAPREENREPVAKEPLSAENARKMVDSIFGALRDTMRRNADGNIQWSSPIARLKGVRTCGAVSVIADVGAYCAAMLRSAAMREHHDDAWELAAQCTRRLRAAIGEWASIEGGEIAGILSPGWYGGLGGILSSCDAMERVGVPEARETVGSLIRLIESRNISRGENLAVSEGTAGLLLALTAADGEETRAACVRACAERLLEEIGKPLAPRDEAGIGTALSAAYKRLGDERYAKMALEAFSRVRHAYDEKLQGWPDSSETLKWLADRGPYAAGIALAADAAVENLGAFPGADALEALRELALDSLLNERELFHSDALDEGNALVALCLTRMGNTEQAGKTLEAMRLRAVRLDGYTVTAPGIRSFFDPSLYLGTLGVAYAAIAWLDATEKEKKEQ